MTRSLQSPYGPVEIGTFREVISIPGRYLNDHCLLHHDGLWHFFGIVGPVGKGCYEAGSECSFAHATSADLIDWTIHPDVLQVDGTGPDSNQVFAPHVVAHDGRFWMFYAGVDAKRRQRICLATSDDLFSWTRLPANPVVVPSLFWASWPGHDAPENDVGDCRDNHVMQLDDGRWVMYWVAELNDRFGAEEGAIAASVSDDLVHWQEIGPLFSMRHWHEPPTRMTESPCVVRKDGHWWLFFKHGWWTYVVRGDSPFDFRGRTPVRLGFAHAAEVFEWNGRWHITHCSGDPADYRYGKSNRKHGLFLGDLDWPDGEFPSLK